MAKIGEIYSPSEVSFEDKDTRIIVDAIRCGRVEYTNLITKEYGEITIDDFGWYYDKFDMLMPLPPIIEADTTESED